jgi:hypothetical protein
MPVITCCLCNEGLRDPVHGESAIRSYSRCTAPHHLSTNDMEAPIWLKCLVVAPSRVTDPSNKGELQFTSHRNAAAAKHVEELQVKHLPSMSTPSASASTSTSTPSYTLNPTPNSNHYITCSLAPPPATAVQTSLVSLSEGGAKGSETKRKQGMCPKYLLHG